MGTFYDWSPDQLPKDAQYYFNVMVIIIYAPEEVMGDIEMYWDIRGVNEARPYAICFNKINPKKDDELAAEFGEEV